ncbi:MAG TPA: ferrous iron transporter B [Polyangiaceae bacterium]|nr:ferrous iron transporter B [Polyangiaceae bacterium]
MTFNFDSLAGGTTDAAGPAAGVRSKHSKQGVIEGKARYRALLVGQPNVGKSVVFGALTGTYVTVSNYPGTTVEVTRGTSRFGAELWEIVDTPGTHNLVPMTEDEAVTRDLLVSETHDALVQIGDAKNLTRTLLLGLQLAELGIPFCLDLNMLDEARGRGLTIDLAALELELPGIRVNASTAIDGEGLDAVRDYLAGAVKRGAAARDPLSCAPRFPDDVEAAIAAVAAELEPALPVAKRAIATMLLGGDRGAFALPPTRVGTKATAVARERGAALARAHGVPVFALLSRLRLARAQSIVRKVQRREEAARSNAGTTPRAGWLTAAAIAGPAALLSALAYDGAVARTHGTVATADPLADYGALTVVERLLSSGVLSGWTAPGLAVLGVAACLGAVLVRRDGHARGSIWKLAAAFAGGWTVYFVLSACEWLRHSYTSMPLHAGALAGLALLAVGARMGDRKDAALSTAIGRAATHPAWGPPILGLVLLLAYKVVGVFGAGTAVDFVENRVFGGVVARVSLDPGAPTQPRDETTAADGDVRLVVTPDGASRVIVVGQRRRLGRFTADPTLRVDVYGRGAFSTRRDSGRVAVEGSLRGAEARVWTGHLNRWAYAFFAWLGVPFVTALFVGPYGLITMGITYAVAIVLPVVATFFFVFSILEDSGYLPRLAVMANRLLRTIGLNGRAVLPMVLGLGCDTMATLTARIMETRKERALVTLLLALGIPCSSQLSVIFALMQRTSRVATAVWLVVVVATILGVGWVAARVLPGEKGDFLLEMPPIRRPVLRNLVAKTMARIEWYLKEAVPLFLAGTALLFVLDAAHLLGLIHRAGEPIVHHMLGFTRDGAVADRVSEALLVGFLRRDFGAAGLLAMAGAGRLSPADVAVSMVTITLFIPCIANVFMIAKERGWKVAFAMSGFIFPYAVLVGALVRVGFRLAAG